MDVGAKEQQFASDNNGKQLADPLGQYLGECVSLWKDFYVNECGVNYYDLFVPGNGGAKNIWTNTTDAMLQWFDKVTDNPQIGDTVVYTGGIYGDVALYNGNNTVFGQLGTPVFKPAAVRPMGSPAGYLRLKGEYVGYYDSIPSNDDLTKFFEGRLGRKPTDAELANKQPWGFWYDASSQELHARSSAQNAQITSLQKQLAGQGTQLAPGKYIVQ